MHIRSSSQLVKLPKASLQTSGSTLSAWVEVKILAALCSVGSLEQSATDSQSSLGESSSLASVAEIRFVKSCHVRMAPKEKVPETVHSGVSLQS
eukprot:5978443-Amphidinium_carterae.1